MADIITEPGTGGEGSGSPGAEVKSNLNIKYGTKTGTGNTLKSSNNPSVTPGNIYAVRNSADEVEVYIDTPLKDGETSARKRLDPKIYVGALPAGKNESDIFNNYDVWIDTSGDPTGIATGGTQNNGSDGTDGLMSRYAQKGLQNILSELNKLKLQIVSQSYWNTSTNTYGSNGGNNLDGWLTIVLPDSAVPSGQTPSAYRPVYIDTTNFIVAPPISGGSGS